MTDETSWKTRPLLWAAISAFAASVGYLIAELISQHETTWTALSMLGIFVVLTPLFYAINRRNAKRESGPPSRR